MLAAICFWDMFTSGGAFNPGTAVVCCETFGSPDITASWAAFTSENVVVWAMFASTENALRFGVRSRTFCSKHIDCCFEGHQEHIVCVHWPCSKED